MLDEHACMVNLTGLGRKSLEQPEELFSMAATHGTSAPALNAPSQPAPQRDALDVQREGVYFAGQQFDAMLCVSKILSTAKKNITIIDGYLGQDVLALLSAKSHSVTVTILTKALPQALAPLATAFNQQHRGLSIRSSSAFHDRFVIVDDTDFYHFGASIKDLGKRGFMFSRIEEPEVIETLRKKFKHEWSTASVEI